jgi:uncharacterized protein (DUF1501 family)
MAIDRRQFIRNSALGAVGLSLAEPLLGSKIGRLLAAPLSNKVIVVVNLGGGNDGLNTVIPINQYTRYRQLRKTLRRDLADLLPLNGQPDFGLSKGLAPFQTLFNQGKLAIVNGVGVPKDASGLFDHSAQQYEYQSCDIFREPSPLAPSGWLGRYLDTVTPGIVAPGIDFGGGRLMLTGNSFDPLTIYSISELQLRLSFDQTARRAGYESVLGVPSANPVGELNRNLRIQGLAQSDAIRAATINYVPAVTYPDSGLGHALRQCAKIISGNLGVHALSVGEGGFDTHARQDDGATATQLGYHDDLWNNVTTSVKAFYDDLVAHGLSNDVIILTMSEFGRTAYENSDHGTDHGFSSMAFVVGDAVHGGIYGLYPGLDQQFLVFDDVTDMTTDFRSVYSTVLANFVGVDPVPAVGGSFPLLGFV